VIAAALTSARQTQIEWRLCRPPELREAGRPHHAANTFLAGLRAQRRPTSCASDAGVQIIVEAE
jgi:hypothetical protein